MVVIFFCVNSRYSIDFILFIFEKNYHRIKMIMLKIY